MEPQLTKRETEILVLVMEELTSESIAAKLNLSIRTVETHRKNIVNKTQCRSALSLLKFAIRRGLLKDYIYRSSTPKRGADQRNNKQ